MMNFSTRRPRVRSRWIGAALAVAWLAAVAPASSAQADGALSRTGHMMGRFGEGAFDVIWLRPLSATALVVGSAMFVVSAPIVAPFEGLSPAWSAFVYAPFEYTVLRPIGDF
jgi:hypothetical protein